MHTLCNNAVMPHRRMYITNVTAQTNCAQNSIHVLTCATFIIKGPCVTQYIFRMNVPCTSRRGVYIHVCLVWFEIICLLFGTTFLQLLILYPWILRTRACRRRVIFPDGCRQSTQLQLTTWDYSEVCWCAMGARARDPSQSSCYSSSKAQTH